MSYLPFSLDRIEFTTPLPAHAFAHAVAHGGHRYDIALAAADGRVVVRMIGLTFRPTRPGPEPVLLHRVWRESAVESTVHAAAGPVVLLDDSESRRDDLARRLGVEVRLVRPEEDLGSALASASCVVHAWSRAALTLDEQLDRGVHSLFRVSQTLLRQRTSSSVRILYVHPELPAYSAVRGFLKTLRQENPRITCNAVAVPERIDLVEVISRELADRGSEDVRYSGERRFTAHLEEIQIAAGTRPLRRGGVYLITGGAGGLGRIFARHLSDAFDARVVLTGRSPLTADEEATLGAPYIRADVGLPDDMRRLLDEIRARFGGINGILHSAGVLRDGLLMKQSQEDLAAVIAPKVFGTANLAAALRPGELDVFVLFSSIASVLGNVGQAAYAFANGYLDAFAETYGGRALAINWPLWEEGSMQAPADVIEWAKSAFGVHPLTTAVGLRAFTQALDSGLTGVAVLAGDRRTILDRLTVRPSVATGVTAAADPALVAPDDLREMTERYLAGVLAREAKLSADEIAADVRLEDYGIDSVMVLDATRVLEAVFGRLSKTLFFEFESIADLAGYFLGHHRATLASMFTAAIREPSSTTRSSAGHAASGVFRSVASDSSGLPAASAVEGRPGESAPIAASPGPVAIIGLSGRYPMAANLREFWRNLEQGRDCITEIPSDRWDYEQHADSGRWGGFLDGVDRFDALFFHISPREANLIDPQERLFLQTAWHTIEDAGYTRRRLADARVGVYVGVMWSEYQLLGLDAAQAPSATYASIANRVSFFLNFRGTSLAVDTMCSSSLTALHLACESLRHGENDYALAGGVNLSLHRRNIGCCPADSSSRATAAAAALARGVTVMCPVRASARCS